MLDDVNEYNRRVHEGIGILSRGTFRACMFADDCTEPVIQAHSVSRAMLAELAENGHVIQPRIKSQHDGDGRSYPQLEFHLEGINRASTGTFVCRTHDAAFTEIDTAPVDFANPQVCDLLFFRAVLKDAWQLFKAQFATMWFEREKRLPVPLPTHPNTRLRALLGAMKRVRPWLQSTPTCAGARPVVHLVRRMRTDHPIVAASCAGGGSDLAFDHRTGRELSPIDVRAVTGTDSEHLLEFYDHSPA